MIIPLWARHAIGWTSSPFCSSSDNGAVEQIDRSIGGSPRPCDQLGHALLQWDRRRVPKPIARKSDVGRVVANVERPSPIGDLRFDRCAEQDGQRARDLQNGDRVSGSHVDREEIGAGLLEHQHQAAHDVVNGHEITQLPPVLEHDWLPVVEETAQKDGRHARVRVAQALSRAVDIEEAGRDRGNAVGLANEQHHLFLVVLGHRIDIVAVQRFVFRGGHRAEFRAAARTPLFPLLGGKLRRRTQPRRPRAARAAFVSALAVDADGRRDDHLLDMMPLVHEDIEQQRRATGVDVDVPIDFIHALPDADGGSKMHDGIGLHHERLQRLPIADVPPDVPCLGIHVRRPRAGPMHLRDETVQHDHVVTAGHEDVDEVRSDVAGSPGHQHVSDTHRSNVALRGGCSRFIVLSVRDGSLPP